MLSTPLYAEHQRLGAKFVPFAGFQMPVSYGAVKDEVAAVRERCGMFDVSHMLPISLRAKNHDDLVAALNRVLVRVLDKLKPGKAQYNALYNSAAGLVDDITLSAIDDNNWLLVANAGNRDADVALLREHISDLVDIQPWTDYTLIAVQGPQAHEFLRDKFGFIETMYYYEVHMPNASTFLGRMGYTGEDGFEIACKKDEGMKLWQDLIAAGVTPCGLAARDVLRLEALMPLYGNELNGELRPQESGIGFLYADHPSIAPRDKREAPVELFTAGFYMTGEGVPRKGYPILQEDGMAVGSVTSGTFSFTNNYGMGMLRINASAKDSQLYVEIRGEKKPIALLRKAPIRGSVRKRPKP